MIFKFIIIKETFWKDLQIWVYIFYCLYFVRLPCEAAVLWWRSSNCIYLHWVMSQTVATSTNKWIQKLTERKWPYMTENPNYDKFRKIPNISRYKHFAFSARKPGRVSLPEFPTSATFYVTILSNDQVMPNVESVNDLDSFTIFICLSVKWARLVFDYLYDQIYRKSTTRMRATSHARGCLRR